MTEPTGNCFENCARALIDQPEADWKLVHAVCTGHPASEIAGVRYGHAFLLLGDDMVLDMTTDRAVLVGKDEYYELGKVQEVAVYDRAAMLLQLRYNRHFGPWAPEFHGMP